MRRSKTRPTSKAGLPPGSLVHIGSTKLAPVKIRYVVYDAERLQEAEGVLPKACQGADQAAGITWINLDGVHEAEQVAAVGQCLRLHPLTLEDIMNTAQRPKSEDYDDYIYMVVKMFAMEESSHRIQSEQVSLVLGRQTLISFQEVEGDVFDGVRERLRKGRGRIRSSGADYLAYALLDAIVDQYFTVLEAIGDRLEQIEEEILERPSTRTLQALHELRGELIFLRKQVWPTREVLNRLTHAESPLIEEPTTLFFRDVYDHTIQVMEAVESTRDVLTSLFDVYLTMVSHRTNEIMRVLTVMASIFIPLTFLVGIYGMNFRYMPELQWPWGYPLVWLVMVVMVLAMLGYFKRKNWL